MKDLRDMTPIENKGGLPGLEFLLVSFAIGKPKVAKHHARLGNADSYFQNRLWIWEKPGLWRVYVGDAFGIEFQVPILFTHEQAIAAWEDYKKDMGVTPEAMAATSADYRKAVP